MCLSARTAPKATGKDFITTRVLSGEVLERLADEMTAYGQASGKKNFDRDGENVRNSGAVVLIGLKGAQTASLNCGACGFNTCSELKEHQGPEFDGPVCAWRLVDLGIAVGSAVKTASMLNVDNRIMYRIGVVAKKMGLCDDQIVLGIPLSATGKSIYFDRGR
ncbi:MAG: ferredoxin domain-containing protein [Bacillota bacterium]